MDTPNFYNALKEFSRSCDNPDGACACYEMLQNWLGASDDEEARMAGTPPEYTLEGGYESQNWQPFLKSISRLTRENGVAWMEGWWTALLWCGEQPGSIILPESSLLPEDVRDMFPIGHKARMAKLLDRIHGKRLCSPDFYCNPNKDVMSRAYLMALAEDAEAAKALTDAVGLYCQNVMDTDLALAGCRGLMVSGQLGSSDMTEGYATCSVQSLAKVLDHRLDIPHLKALSRTLEEAVEGRPNLVAPKALANLRETLAPARGIDSLLAQAQRWDFNNEPTSLGR